MFNSLTEVTSLLLGSPVVVLPPFTHWTGMSCDISSVNDGSVKTLGLGTQNLVSLGRLHQWQVRMVFGYETLLVALHYPLPMTR